MAVSILAPIHPGEVLLAEFLESLGISQYRLAKDISVSPRRINEIVHGTRSVTADTALRLARYFGTSDRFWLNLQTSFDLDVERDRLGTGSRLKCYHALADKPEAGHARVAGAPDQPDKAVRLTRPNVAWRASVGLRSLRPKRYAIARSSVGLPLPPDVREERVRNIWLGVTWQHRET